MGNSRCKLGECIESWISQAVGGAVIQCERPRDAAICAASFAQERLWLEEQLRPGGESSLLNLPMFRCDVKGL